MLARQKSTLLKGNEKKDQWWLVDLEGQTLGRVATRVADILRGKHRPTFTPHVDGGDFVIAINADKIKLTGKKWEEKKYYHHSGFPGGIKERNAKAMQKRHPDALLTKAVKGMLPQNYLSKKLLTKLRVYGGSEHPHQAQNPKPLKLR